MRFVNSTYVVGLLFMIELRLANALRLLLYDFVSTNHILLGGGENYFLRVAVP